MDMKSLQLKLGLFDEVKVFRKAQELLRLCRVHFDSSSFGVVSIAFELVRGLHVGGRTLCRECVEGWKRSNLYAV